MHSVWANVVVAATLFTVACTTDQSTEPSSVLASDPIAPGSVSVTTPSSSVLDSCRRTVNASTFTGLKTALAASLPGDCILLAPGTYSASSAIRITRSGTASAPITIQGGGWGNTVINLQQQEFTFETVSYVTLRKMRLTNWPQRGFWIRDSHYTVLDSLEIDNTKQVAVTWKDLSTHNVLQYSRIHDTGKLNPQWGEAVYVGGSASTGYPQDFGVTDNQIIGNVIGPNVTAQAVDVSSGADRTLIRGNMIDGTGSKCCGTGYGALVDVIASGVIVENNSIQKGTPNAVRFMAPAGYTMTGAIARNNTIDLRNVHNFTSPYYYGFNLTAGTTAPGRVTIKCNNTVINGRFSNMACIP